MHGLPRVKRQIPQESVFRFIPSFYPLVLVRHGQHATGGGKYTRKSASWPRQSTRTHQRDTSIFCELKDALSTRTSIRTERRKWRQLHRTSPYPAFCLTSDESIGNWVSIAFYSRKSRFASLPNRIPHGIGYPSSIIAPTPTNYQAVSLQDR